METTALRAWENINTKQRQAWESLHVYTTTDTSYRKDYFLYFTARSLVSGFERPRVPCQKGTYCLYQDKIVFERWLPPATYKVV